MVEVITAVVIVGVLFMSLYAGISYSFAGIRLARENLRATQILTEKIEVVRLCTWEQVNSNGFLPAKFKAPYEPGGPTNALAFQGKILVRTAPVGLLPAQYSNDMRRVYVTVDWTSGGVDRTREVYTYVSRYGLQNYILKLK